MPSCRAWYHRCALSIIACAVLALGAWPLAAAPEALPGGVGRAPEPSALRAYNMQRMLKDRLPARDAEALTAYPCIDGSAGGYPCRNVDLEGYLPLSLMGGGEGNDIWGWTDPETGKEYALVGRTTGTAFVDVSVPTAPRYIGDLPTHTESSLWRDIKVYADHAYIVSEASGHGLQVFDLTRLRGVTSPPVTFTETAHYGGFGNAHNLAINEESGFGYAIGSSTCSGGPHMVDLRVPGVPSFAGCLASEGYTHDTQCVIYHGRQKEFVGRELCFLFNESLLVIADVTDKAAPLILSRNSYPERGYTHQGWLTEGHDYVLMDDELDELDFGVTTRTHMWRIEDLRRPVYLSFYTGSSRAIDHNLYTLGSLVFASNYTSGLRILSSCCLGTARMTEVGFFDVDPDSDSPRFNGSWSNFPYYSSGIVVVNSIERGLFVVRPRVPPPDPAVGPGCFIFDDGSLPRLANELRLVKDGAYAVLSVSAAPPIGGGFDVYASAEKGVAGTLRGPAPSTVTRSYRDAVLRDGSTFYYKVRALSGCAIEGP